MQAFSRFVFPLLMFISVIGFVFWGCSSSEPAAKENEQPQQPSATELMQKEMHDLKLENDTLKNKVTTLEQDKRSAIARNAELETQISELKEKLAAPPPPPPKPAISEPVEKYNGALNLFRERKYSDAAEQFRQVIDGGTPQRLLDNCYYWMGECLYGEKKYKEAIEEFKKVFTFRFSEKKDESQIMIANSYFALGDKVNAKAEYETLLKKFPASPYAKRAKEKLEKLP